MQVFTEVLTWQHNRVYITKIKAAIKAGIRPVAMLFHEQPNDPWTALDFLLIEAMQMLEDETCQQCGNPIWICRNDQAANVGFKIKIATCYAKYELDRWQEAEDKKQNNKTYGQYPYVIAYTYDDSDMPSRQQYYEYLAQKHNVK